MKYLVYSESPARVEIKVNAYIKEGYDLDGSPFVMADNLCQWMAQGAAINEYKLVSAFLPREFERTVKDMEDDGWHLFGMAPVNWNGMLFQWMARRLATPLGLEDAAVTVSVPGYRLVEDARVSTSLSRLAPLGGA